MSTECTEWDTAQIRIFAKQIADSKEATAWWAFPFEVRDAIIARHVLSIVFSIRGQNEISVDEIRSLRNDIERRLAEHHKLSTTPRSND